MEADLSLEELVTDKTGLYDLECLVKTARGRLHLRAGRINALERIIKLLHNQDTIEVGLMLVSTLCKDCDAALEFGLRGLHPLLSRLARTCSGEILDLVYVTVQAAASGLPPGHTFPMERGLEGNYPPHPHLLHLPSITLQVRCDTSIRLHSQGDVGRLLWPAAMVMSRWLLRTAPAWLPPSTSPAACRLLELGAGVGVTGLAAAQMVGHVTLTDNDPAVLANLHYNAALVRDRSHPTGPVSIPTDLPQGHTLEVQTLDWKALSQCTEKYDVIIGSDIVCCEADGAAVAGVVASLLAPNGQAHLLLPPAFVRYGVELLERKAKALGLSVAIENIAREDVKGLWEEDWEREEDIAIGGGYEDTLQLHSFTW